MYGSPQRHSNWEIFLEKNSACVSDESKKIKKKKFAKKYCRQKIVYIIFQDFFFYSKNAHLFTQKAFNSLDKSLFHSCVSINDFDFGM